MSIVKKEHIETTNYMYCTSLYRKLALRSNFDGHFIPTSWMIFSHTVFTSLSQGPKSHFRQRSCVSPTVMPQLEQEERQLYKRLDTRSIFFSFLINNPVVLSFVCHKLGLRTFVIVHTILPPTAVILWIELGGWLKWLPLNFGYNDVMHTAPILVERFLILITER